LSDISDDSDSGSDVEETFSEVSKYFRTPVDKSKKENTPLHVDKSVQTKTLPNINSSVQTDSSSNIDSSVQTDSSLKGDNILDETTKNEILQLFSQIEPVNLDLEDIEYTFNPENTPAASEVLETSLVKNSPALKKAVRFIDGHEERIFPVTTEEFESKKKGYKFWLESTSAVSQASDSEYSPSPISPLEGSP
jgi:hypothetical protein